LEKIAILVDGPQVRAFVRFPHEGHPLLTAVSGGFGRTWATTAGSNLQWAYPCAIHHGDELCVAYAGTKVNAELSAVDITELTP